MGHRLLHSWLLVTYGLGNLRSRTLCVCVCVCVRVLARGVGKRGGVGGPAETASPVSCAGPEGPHKASAF